MSILNKFDLTGRVALITGGRYRIGKGCAIALAQAGASVMIVGRRMEKLLEVQREIEAVGGHLCLPFCRSYAGRKLPAYGRSLHEAVRSAGHSDQQRRRQRGTRKSHRRIFHGKLYPYHADGLRFYPFTASSMLIRNVPKTASALSLILLPWQLYVQ